MKKLRIEYIEASLETIMRYYIRGYELPKNEAISTSEWFIDQQKERVIFKLFIETNEDE